MKECSLEIIDRTLTSATMVHRKLGPGLLETIYERALLIELQNANLSAERQVKVPVYYEGVNLGVGYRADIIVENSLLLELKSVNEFTDIHLAQTITYLKLLDIKRGFLINFNKKLLKHGIKRVSI